MFIYRSSRLSFLLFAVGLVCGPCEAQEILLPTEARECGLLKQLAAESSAPGPKVSFLAPLGNDTIVGVRGAVGQAGGETLIVCSPNQEDRVLARLPSNRRPLAAAGGRILIGDSTPVNGRVVAHILHVKTGEEITVETPRGFFASALSSKALALLGPGTGFTPSHRSGPSILLLYDPDTGRPTHEATLDVSPISHLYFASPEMLVVAPAGTFSFVQVHLKETIQADPPVTLSGPEVRTASRSHDTSRSPGGLQQLIQAYVPGPDGSHFFVLPSPIREGVRLVKFDRQGTEIASYRLLPGSGRPERLSPSSRTVFSSATEIVVASFEGPLFVFRRPQ
jgi:hypothetical protein